jgi:hypothetical protein
VLAGHSYAGSASPGWPACRPERIAALVYLDAFLPRDGDCCWVMTNDEQRELYATGCAQTSYGVDPAALLLRPGPAAPDGDNPAGAAADPGLA